MLKFDEKPKIEAFSYDDRHKKRKILLKKHVSEASKYEFDHLSVDNKRNV